MMGDRNLFPFRLIDEIWVKKKPDDGSEIDGVPLLLTLYWDKRVIEGYMVWLFVCFFVETIFA